MIQKQDVYVNDKGQTIRSLTEVSGGVVIGEPKFVADFVITVQAGPGQMQVTITSDLEGATPEDAFASIPVAYEAAKPKAIAAVEQQLKLMQMQAEEEARKIVVPGAAARLNGSNGHPGGLRLNR